MVQPLVPNPSPSPLSAEDALRLIDGAAFGEPQVVARGLRQLWLMPGAAPTLTTLWPHLALTLTRTASPDRAFVNLLRFVQAADDPAALVASLAESPRTVELLLTLFAGSQFLSEILLRNPDYLPRLADRAGLAQIKSAAQFATEAEPEPAAEPDASLDALRRFQQWEMLRIGLSDLCGMLDLFSITQQLSFLAEGVTHAALAITARRSRIDASGFVVLAMGKLGGAELNYSSDIDLLFIADEDAQRYLKLGERLIAALSRSTAEGFLYRVDMRLRPWGGVGALVVTMDGYLRYLKEHARLWEKQALLRARPIAGNLALGRRLLHDASELLFTTSPETVRADVHAMKQRTEARLRELGQEWGEVKLGEGSIRDVEFVAQYLQLANGAGHPELRGGTTLEVLARLGELGCITSDEYRVLSEGYVFLRTVEHYLQILEYRQTHILPQDPADQHYLAQRLGYTGAEAAQRFVTRYQQHSTAVRAVYWRHLAAPMVAPLPKSMPRSQDGPSETRSEASQADRLNELSVGGTAMAAPVGQSPEPATGHAADPVEAIVSQHLAQMSPSYAEVFSEADIRRHADLAARLSDANPVEVRAEAIGDSRWRVTIVAYDYLGELSAICGLLFAHGFNIQDGHVFTYEAEAGVGGWRLGAGGGAGSWRLEAGAGKPARRKIVDVFTVDSTRAEATAGAGAVGRELWRSYAGNLAALLRLIHGRHHREAQGELVKQVAGALQEAPSTVPTLQAVNIEIDNESSERHTLLRIEAPDTPGFLYEFTNALSLNGVYIVQVAIASIGSRVHDLLYVTDTQGRKIIDPNKQRELRAATVLVKHFTHLLPHSPNPEAALQHFNEYLGELFRRPSWPDELASLERPEVLDALARLLGVSNFLWDDFLRMQYANLFPVVADVGSLATPRSQAELSAELAGALAGATDGETRRERLNAFKDREMFRIDMRHILGHIAEFGQFSAELTDLAETVLAATTRMIYDELSPSTARPSRRLTRGLRRLACARSRTRSAYWASAAAASSVSPRTSR